MNFAQFDYTKNVENQRNLSIYHVSNFLGVLACQTILNYIYGKTEVINNRTSHQRCSMKKSVLRISAKFTGKHLCQSLFFNKVAGLRPAIFLKKRLWHRCFPVNFAKFLRTPFLQNSSGRLLLKQHD